MSVKPLIHEFVGEGMRTCLHCQEAQTPFNQHEPCQKRIEVELVDSVRSSLEDRLDYFERIARRDGHLHVSGKDALELIGMARIGEGSKARIDELLRVVACLPSDVLPVKETN